VNAFYRRVEAGIVDPSALIGRVTADEHISPEAAKMLLDGLDFFSAPKASNRIGTAKEIAVKATDRAVVTLINLAL